MTCLSLFHEHMIISGVRRLLGSPFDKVAVVQGDQEKALHMPVSPLMDRTQTGGMTRSQVALLHTHYTTQY